MIDDVPYGDGPGEAPIDQSHDTVTDSNDASLQATSDELHAKLRQPTSFNRPRPPTVERNGQPRGSSPARTARPAAGGSRPNSRPGSRKGSGAGSAGNSISSSAAALGSFNGSVPQLEAVEDAAAAKAGAAAATGELDWGTSDAPRPEGKRVAKARANIWGLRIEKASYTNRCGCTAIKLIVQDEVRITIWVLLFFVVLVAGIFFLIDLSGRVSVLFVYNGYAHAVAATIAGIFSFVACMLTWAQVQAHRRHWVHPSSQKHVVRILLMVPVYAISSWMSLAFVNLSAYLDFIRNCYEAYVIWSFMLLLTEYLGGHHGVATMMRIKLKQKWPFPMCCMPRAKPDSKFLWYLKYGALQYVILSPVIALLTVVLTWAKDSNGDDLYRDGEFRYDRGFAYISFLQNATQLLSLYTLAWLYLLMKQELKPYKPMPKFLVVKSVVFFTFWQGVALALFAKMDMLHDTENFSVGELQVGLQDFLVCVEMFIAAAVHKYTFGYETYVDGTFAVLMEQRRHGDNSAPLPAGARVRIIHESSEGKRIWEPSRLRSDTGTSEVEEPQVLTLIVEEPDGVPPALFDDEFTNEIDANAGADAPAGTVADVSHERPIEMAVRRPSNDGTEQGVDSMMDIVDD